MTENKATVSDRNKKLKADLLAKGYYVSEVGTSENVVFLLVTTAAPNEMPFVEDALKCKLG